LGLIFFCNDELVVVSVLQLYKSSDSVRVRLLSTNEKSGLCGGAVGVIINWAGNVMLLFTAAADVAGVTAKGRFSCSFDVMESSMKTLFFLASA
jgi:hypothetical protein